MESKTMSDDSLSKEERRSACSKCKKTLQEHPPAPFCPACLTEHWIEIGDYESFFADLYYGLAYDEDNSYCKRAAEWNTRRDIWQELTNEVGEYREGDEAIRRTIERTVTPLFFNAFSDESSEPFLRLIFKLSDYVTTINTTIDTYKETPFSLRQYFFSQTKFNKARLLAEWFAHFYLDEAVRIEKQREELDRLENKDLLNE